MHKKGLETEITLLNNLLNEKTLFFSVSFGLFSNNKLPILESFLP